MDPSWDTTKASAEGYTFTNCWWFRNITPNEIMTTSLQHNCFMMFRTTKIAVDINMFCIRHFGLPHEQKPSGNVRLEE